MTSPPILRANATLVAIAWIGSIPGLSPDMVDTQLPPDAEKDTAPAQWVTKGLGFATVQTVGGSPAELIPARSPVVQVDCYATNPGSNKPPWLVASHLAETIVLATYDRLTMNRQLAISVKGVAYPSASVQAAQALTEPRQLFDDAGDYARFQFDLQLRWIQLNDVLA